MGFFVCGGDGRFALIKLFFKKEKYKMVRQEYDWVDRTLFLLFAYAHITDWELADSERSVIQSKTNYILKKINGNSPQHSSDEIELKMITGYKYWNENRNFDRRIGEINCQYNEHSIDDKIK